MRNHLIIILLILTSCNNDSIDKSDLYSFSDIEIRFRTGDERIEFYSMDILKEGEKIKAIKKSPFYYYGNRTDSTWTTEIDKSDLNLIKEFLKRANSFDDTCSLSSSSIDYYEIKTNGQKTNIVGNCQWNGIDYDSLELKIFEQKFIELNKNREAVIDSIAKSLVGTWDVHGWENGVLKNRNLVLTKTLENKPMMDGQYRWTFNEQDQMELKNKLNANGRGVLIKIGASTYEVLKIEPKKIDLKYMW